MKSVEKWIIVVLSVIVIASIGTAVYFGVKLQDDKVSESENIKNNNQEKNNIDQNDKISNENSDEDESGKVELEDLDKIAENLMQIYIGAVSCEFQGEYTDEIKTLVLINNTETNQIADCKKVYGKNIESVSDNGYNVIGLNEEILGTICEKDSLYYDAKILRKKSNELFGKDIVVKKGIQSFYGNYYDYVTAEDSFINLSCRCGDMCGSNYEISSSYFENNQLKIEFKYIFRSWISGEKNYVMLFDVKSDGKYVFNDLIEQ